MRARGKGERATEETGRIGVDANAVVSYNLRVIRERYGWTQQAVAERLSRLTGHQLPQASISAMERGFDGDRRRRFDAHELYLLSEVFEVPMAYFFAPPAGGVDRGPGPGRHGPADLRPLRRPPGPCIRPRAPR